MSFDKVLIANRGEIAVRVIRGCRKLGYATVAVYSDADRDALHVQEAHEAVRLGPAPAQDSYLAIDRILAAAKATGTGAIHPGYGFLSESAAFAQAVEDAGRVFIGPDPASIAAMGNKSAAKLRMIAAGVPCIPGYQGEEQSDEGLVREARKLGLPVMVKAAAGGGGRGMRLVRDESELLACIQSARSEAANAFGDGQLLLEKAVVDARHVEIQVFGDLHGNIVHFGERDCSVQRRNQKVIEEAPSPAVDEALRAKMGAAAVAAAKAVKYVGAGTVEFMLAPDGAYYFLEMNTRLQVEHPVTESIYGVDLVEWQLRVAQGEKLPLGQEEILAKRLGWAIEVRLCSEDPASNFLPQTGPLLAWRAPSGPGVRVDHGLRVPGAISPHYDSLQAKLIATGANREEARRRLIDMLAETVLLGVPCNRDFLLDVLAHTAFASGDFSTGFIAEHLSAEHWAKTREPDRAHRALAAALVYRSSADVLRQEAGIDDELLCWQSSAPASVPVLLRAGELSIESTVTPLGEGRFDVVLGDGRQTVELLDVAAPDAAFVLEGLRGHAFFAREGDALWLSCHGLTLRYEDITLAAAEKSASSGDGRLLAPMDGRIVAVLAQAGAAVKKGETLAVLEAMKMQFQIASSIDGHVETISCEAGQQVKARQLLLALREAPHDASPQSDA